MQLRVWHIARSILSNWFATLASIAVGFFLAPFIVHRLGNVAYGIWVLAISSVSYLSLLDLGMASSVVRYVSKGHATGDHQGASEALSTVLWVRLQISLVLVILSATLAASFSHIFKIPPALVSDSRIAILIIGATATISMSFGVFSSTLSALNRYDLRSLIAIVQLTIRVAGVVSVLLAGRGIVAIALCELAAAAVGSSLLVFFARRTYPELRISLARPPADVLRRMWIYSAYAFVNTLASQLVYQSDNVVVGIVVSAAAVTFYSIGNSLCRNVQQLIGAMSMTFTPAASSCEAAGDLSGLRALYYNGTRATVAISLPVFITLIVRGKTFVGLWMGPQYAGPSGTVLAILALALLLSTQNSAAGAIAYGVEKHKELAKWSLAEAVSNLTLSVVLAHYIGMYGVAIGTLIPCAVINLFLWPRYLSRIVDIKPAEVYRRVWGPVLASGIPFALASFAVDRYIPARHMVSFLGQTVLLLPVFGLFAALIFREKVQRLILPRVKSLLYSGAR